MNILIDIGHPAHVHLLKYTATELEKKGHKVFFAVRNLPVAKRLMEIYGMSYIYLGGKKDTLIGKLKTVLGQDWKIFRFVIRNKINIGLSSGIVIPHVSNFTSMKAFTFDDDDDDVEPLVVKYAHPYSDIVLTPSAIQRKTDKALYYAGTHELAYLHPKRFIPDHDILKRAGLKDGETFFIMRFVAFKGHHDVGQYGLSIEEKKKLINLMEKYGRVIISSERAIEQEFEQYRLPVPPEDIHSLMFYSSMFVGDSQTMTSEAAILGVPALKCNTFAGKLSVPNMLEKYGLSYSYQPSNFNDLYAHVESLLKKPNLKEEWLVKKENFLRDMIDPTSFYVWFIENYPESKRIMKENPDYQYQFR